MLRITAIHLRTGHRHQHFISIDSMTRDERQSCIRGTLNPTSQSVVISSDKDLTLMWIKNDAYRITHAVPVAHTTDISFHLIDN